jgi:hypothetical protein
LKLVIWEDDNGHKYQSLLRDQDPESNADRGLLVGPPPVTELDWDGIQRDLNRALFNQGLFTWDDVQGGGDKLVSAILSTMRKRLITLYRRDTT